MFNWLSPGLGSVLGGLFGAGGSLGGAAISASEQQQMNQANIQQGQYMATGGYLPGLIANANKAGINPLAVLGMHSPGFGTSISSGSGAGAAGAGQAISSAFNQLAHEDRLARSREDLANEEVLNARKSREQMTTAIDSQKIVADTNRWLLAQMRATGSPGGSAIDQLLRGVWNRPGLNFGIPGGSNAGVESPKYLIPPGYGFPGLTDQLF